MKQLLFVFLLALTLGACKKKETVTTTPEATTTETTAAPATESNATPTAVDANLDKGVQEIMNAWNLYVQDYETAVKAKDATKLSELTSQLQAIQGKTAEIIKMAKVNNAETADKVTAFMNEKMAQITKIAQSMK
jgi:hypothetical protein